MFIIKSFNQFINENVKYNDFIVVYDTDKQVSHVTSKKREDDIHINGFKTGHELNVAEKRKAIFFADKDVNYGMYARNKEGETNDGEDIGVVTVNLKGLKLLNMTYKDDNNKFINYNKYNNYAVRGELDSIPYDIDGTISYLEDGRIYEVALKKEIANKLIKK
jgi:hypothetical protein